MVKSPPRPHFTPGKDPVPILQDAGWAPGPVWTGGKSRPHWDSIPDRPARSQSLYRLSYRAHYNILYNCYCTTEWLLSNILTQVFRGPPHSLQANVWMITTASSHIPSYSSFTSHPITRPYVVEVLIALFNKPQIELK